MRNKYHAKKKTVDGITFDSTSEANYYEKYRDMEKAGEIQNLRLQVPYELIPAIWEEYDEVVHLKTKDKVVHRRKLKQRAVTYIADFVFTKDGIEYVVDVKGGPRARTKEYLLKKKMMLALKGIEITEVYYSGLKPKRTTRKRNLSLVCLLCQFYHDLL